MQSDKDPATPPRAPVRPDDLLVLAGAGTLPRLVVEGARRAGVPRVGVLGVKGAVEGRSFRGADWRGKISLGSVAKFREAVRASGFRHAILAGQVSPLAFFRAAFDPEIRSILAGMGAHNAHTMFGRLVEELAALGCEVLPSSLFLGPHVPAAGVLTARPPTEAESAAAAFGAKIALAVCDLDVGQTVVAKDGVALAVEGFDGTNATILRGGRIARGGAVVVKVAKRGHDMRFDIPVVGLKTLAVMKKARCTALAVQAGRTLFIDLPAVVRRADKLGMCIVAFDSGLPPAPVLPPSALTPEG